MTETTYPILPARKRAKMLAAMGFDLLGLAAAVLALTGWGWGFWLVAVALFAASGLKILSWARMKAVARVDAGGVTLWLPTGREVTARWGEIEAHTIDPARRLGGIVVRAGAGGRVRVLPVATGDMGAEAAAALLAAMKDRLPKLEYRVPSVGGGNT